MCGVPVARTLKSTVEIPIPEGATHYIGDALNGATFYKCSQVGVGGDHWWWYNDERKIWFLASHHRPHWIKEIPSDRPNR